MQAPSDSLPAGLKEGCELFSPLDFALRVPSFDLALDLLTDFVRQTSPTFGCESNG